ncbi:class I SAM-dependent methyltransferase [Paraburkholderia aspalathi]|uniref:hypothetical protein n=1 Tax=Paraburkholderia aspalathi TaxID=1324617 RepID=UPI0038BDBD6E
MKIPFGLHRRIPRVRRVLEMLASATTERDALREDLKAALRHIEVIQADLAGQKSVAAPRYPYVVAIPDQALGAVALRMLSLLRPMDVVGKKLIRKGRPNDGGYLMIDSGLDGVVAYSLGINDDVSWDLDMAALGCQIYQYDHTIDALPKKHPNFHWYRTGIAAQPSADGVLQPLGDLIARNGHAGRRDLILKMDIEGYEWEVFDSMEPSTLAQFSQISMEMHTLALAPHDLQAKIASVLEKLYASHQPVHVHANNHGYFGIIGGVPIPDTLEVTYVRRTDHQFTDCKRIFPTEQDMPCRKDVPDFFLGALGALPAPTVTEPAGTSVSKAVHGNS